MNRFIPKFMVIAIAVLGITSGLGLLLSNSDAQSVSESNYSDHLQRLWETDILFYMGFIHPIDGRFVGWDIPSNIEIDNEVVRQRYIGKLGSDYICIFESGVSHVQEYCIPFTNIAYVTHSTIPE